MEISEVRKRVMEMLDRAKRQAADRRARTDDAARDYGTFLEKVATPIVRQVANALKADTYPFTVFTPAGSVRLMSDRSAQDYVELFLGEVNGEPAVVGHSSRARGSRVTEIERPLAAGKAIAQLTEADVLDFLMKELEAIVAR